MESKVEVFEFSGPKNSWRRHQTWLQVAMAIRRRSNKAFAFKTKRAIFGDLLSGAFQSKFAYAVYLIRNGTRLRSIITYLGHIPCLGSYLEHFFWLRIQRNSNLEALISKVAPNIVIVVSTGAEPLLAEMQKIGQLPCPWVFLPDNWDNVFTKSIFRYRPDEFWVWSEQQLEHLNRTFGANILTIKNVGSSRFSYEARGNFSPVKRRINRDSAAMKILYAGQESPHDEISDLIWITNVLKLYTSSKIDHFKILYRPHPTARARSGKSKPFIQLVESCSLNSKVHIEMIAHGQDLSRRQNKNVMSAIRNVDAVIGAPTTLLLESLFYNVPAAVLLREDGIHRTSSGRIWHHYLHFLPLENFPKFQVIKEQAELMSFLERLNVKQSLIPEKSLGYFIGNYSQPYYLNLIKAIEETLNHEEYSI
jgi:hypothetical protein